MTFDSTKSIESLESEVERGQLLLLRLDECPGNVVVGVVRELHFNGQAIRENLICIHLSSGHPNVGLPIGRLSKDDILWRWHDNNGDYSVSNYEILESYSAPEILGRTESLVAGNRTYFPQSKYLTPPKKPLILALKKLCFYKP